MTDHIVTFFITTARSGTQWVESALNEIYGDLLMAEHEPLRYLYKPRTNLRDLDKLRALRENPRIRAHLERIHEITMTHTYVEVGFPAFALAPLLREEFGDRLRLVQLTRDPVKVAASTVTHNWPDRQDIIDSILPTPLDPGTKLAKYADVWPRLTGFEKGLFYWYEVHSYGLEQEPASPPGTYLRIQFEKLVKDDQTQGVFCDFLGLPRRPDWAEFTSERVDGYYYRTSEPINWAAIHEYPEIYHLAKTLGYEPEKLDPEVLSARYRQHHLRTLAGRFKRRVLGHLSRGKRLIGRWLGRKS